MKAEANIKFHKNKRLTDKKDCICYICCAMVLNATFNNIPFIFWRSVLFGPGRKAPNANVIVFGLTRPPHDLPHLRCARYPLYNRCDWLEFKPYSLTYYLLR